MWVNVLDYALDFVANITNFGSWLFQPFLTIDNWTFASLLYKLTGFTLQVRPVDLLTTGFIGFVLTMLIVKLVNIFS